MARIMAIGPGCIWSYSKGHCKRTVVGVLQWPIVFIALSEILIEGNMDCVQLLIAILLPLAYLRLIIA